MLTILAATLAAAAAPATPLTPIQASALRCAVVFARGARMQADRAPAAAAWPDLRSRGREYFVRVTAKLMDETGADRTGIAELARQVPLADDRAVADAMPACLPLLAAAGL